MKSVWIAAGVLAFANPAFAAPGATSTAQGEVRAEVVAPITVTHTAGAALNFGSLVANSGGTIQLSHIGGISVPSGDVSPIASNNHTPDAFVVTFTAGRTFTFMTSGGVVNSGSNSMSFSTLPSCTLCIFGSTVTSGTIVVGGTLTVAANQAPGFYQGVYTATATYN